MKRRIGGTDIPKLVGQSPYGGPIDVYRRIVEGYRVEQNQAMRRGLLLEPVERQMYLDETGATLRDPHPGFYESPRHAFMSASLDDIATRDGSEVVVEYKSANIRQLDKWGEAGTDQVPREYLLQVAWYMAAMALPVADLAVLIAGDDFRVYRLHRDLELEDLLLEAAERFWVDHVLTGIPPPPDSSEGYSDWLAKRYPADRGPIRLADAEATAWAMKLRAAKRAQLEAEVAEQEARNALCLIIGDAAGISGPGWHITYKQTRGRESTDWQSVATEAGIPKTIIDKHTRRVGYRVFRPNFNLKEHQDE